MSDVDFFLEWIGPSEGWEGQLAKGDDGVWVVKEPVIEEQGGLDVATGELQVTGRFADVSAALDWVFDHNVLSVSVRGMMSEEFARLAADSIPGSSNDNQLHVNDAFFYIGEDGTLDPS